MTLTTARLDARRRHSQHQLDDYQHLLNQYQEGTVNTAPAEEVLALLPQLPN